MTPALGLQAAAVFALASVLSRFGTSRQRRAGLIAGCVAVAALPLLAMAPAWTAPASSPEVVLGAFRALQEPATALPAALGPSAASGGVSAVLGWVWAAGVAVCMARLAADLRAVSRLRASATGRSGDLATSAEVDVPVVIGIVRPLVLLPPEAEAWPASRRDLALAHERAHVRGHDNAWLLLARVVAAVHWFDPLAWWTVAALRDACEHHADDVVLAGGAEPTTYAHALIAVARGRGTPLGLAMARPGGLEARVRGVMSDRRRGGRLSSVVAVAAVVVFAAGAATADPMCPVALASPRSNAAVSEVLEAEADRLVEKFAPEGVALIVLDAHTGALLGQAVRGGLDAQALPPGSVFKPFVVAAALEAGVPRDQVFAGGDLGGVLEVSSNEGALQIAAFAGRDQVSELLARVGLPTPADATLDQLALGGIAVTPMQVAQAYTHLAGSGSIAEPIAGETRKLLVRAVSGEHATGSRAAVPGTSIAGKTGTSPLPGGGHLATFVGLVPADEPERVILVTVSRPQGDAFWGGTVAAPTFRRIVEHLD